MTNETTESLVGEVAKALAENRTLTIAQKERAIAVVLPIKDHQKFNAERAEKLNDLKVELKGLLSLVRNHTQNQSLEEVEAHLAALRQKIEQEMEEE